MKKLVQMLLVACFMFSLAGCYGSQEGFGDLYIEEEIVGIVVLKDLGL